MWDAKLFAYRSRFIQAKIKGSRYFLQKLSKSLASTSREILPGTGPEKSQNLGACKLTASPVKVGYDCVDFKICHRVL
jgi:hypothetical protein